MNIGPAAGIVGSAAGAPLAASRGGEAQRAEQSATTQRQAQSDRLADAAAGIGVTSEDQGASDRDADGRRLWEKPPEAGQEATPPEEPAPPRQVKDPRGEAGNVLDLSG